MPEQRQGNIVAIIEARMTSSRLPGKVLKPLAGRPALEIMVDRLRRSKLLDRIVIATTVNTADDPIVVLAERLGVRAYRGSEEDVLLRVVEAAEANDVDIIVEVTGDCPLIDHRIVDRVIGEYLKGSCDYVANCLTGSYPVGMDAQVFSTKDLRKIESATKDPADREHVSLYFYEKPGRFKVKNVESGLPPEMAGYRLTLDTADDLRLLDEIVRRLEPVCPDFSMEDILALLQDDAKLAAMNSHVQQKAVR